MQRFDIDVVPDRFSAAVYVICKDCGEQYGGDGVENPKTDVRIHDYMRQHIDEKHGGFTLQYENE